MGTFNTTAKYPPVESSLSAISGVATFDVEEEKLYAVAVTLMRPNKVHWKFGDFGTFVPSERIYCKTINLCRLGGSSSVYYSGLYGDNGPLEFTTILSGVNVIAHGASSVISYVLESDVSSVVNAKATFNRMMGYLTREATITHFQARSTGTPKTASSITTITDQPYGSMLLEVEGQGYELDVLGTVSATNFVTMAAAPKGAMTADGTNNEWEHHWWGKIPTMIPMASSMGGESIAWGLRVYTAQVTYDGFVNARVATLPSDWENDSVIIAGAPVMGGANIGSETEIFADLFDGDLRFRTLSAGAGVALISSASCIAISASGGGGGGGGTISGGANIGGFTGIFADAVGSNLRFRSLSAGTGITLLSSASSITIVATTSSVTSTRTLTATGNVDDYDFGTAGVLYVSGASDTSIRGLSAGTDGQELLIVATGANNVELKRQDSNSSAVNRIVPQVASSIWLAGGSGVARLIYDGSLSRWRVINHQQGAAIDVAYNGSNFAGYGGNPTWTVQLADQVTFAFLLDGKVLTVFLQIDSTTVSGTGIDLQILIPNGYVSAKTLYGQVIIQDNGTWSVSQIQAGSAGDKLNVYKDFIGSNWSASTNATSIRGTFDFEIQ